MVKLGIASMMIALLAACALYAMKDRVRRLEHELARMQDTVVDEKVAIGRLRTEWAMLNQPGRLARLASAYLKLEPARPDQIVRIDELPMRADLELADLQLSALLPSGAKVPLRLKPPRLQWSQPGAAGPQR